MYRYEYEKLETGGGFWIDNGGQKHRAVIDRRAQDGWRYAGYVPTAFTDQGGVKAVDLIFEKEVSV